MGETLGPLLWAAAAAAVALLVLQVLRRAWAQYQAQVVARSRDALGEMFLFVEPQQLVLLNAAALAALAAAGWKVGGPFAAVVAGGLGFLAPEAGIRLVRARRVRKLELQLTEALQQLANALRAGLTFLQAAEQVCRDGAPPLSQELGLFLKEVRLGVQIEDALGNLAARAGSDDLELVVTSTNIARALGGNLAEMFETIAGTVRERFRLEGKIRALTSQGKMQGVIVGLLPLGIGLFLEWDRPDLMEPMFEHVFGYALVSAVVALELVGALFIRRIVRIEV